MDLQTVGRYSIVGRIGRGAMGEVYKAFDPVLNRHVAIKMLTAQLGLDAEMRKRFEREAQSAARLTHPNIVTVYELGDEKGSIFIAMELLEGRDLKDLIGLPELRDLGERLRIMDQVLSGVAFAHERGVVHRDLKPANIRVLPTGQVKVVDFGLARMATGADMTQAGTVMGTPNYMSPEQVRGDKADSASDVFALGSVFYELLTGRRAFHTDTLHTTLAKVLTDDPDPLSLTAPEVPEAVQQVVERALNKEQDQRYPNAGQMRVALNAAAPSLGGLRGGRRVGDPQKPGSMSLPAHSMRQALAAREVAEADQTADTMMVGAQTFVPDLTTAESPRPVVASGGSSRAVLFAGLGLAAAAIAIGGVWLALRPSAPAPLPVVPPDAAQQEGALSAAYVDELLQAARIDLQNKQYASAIQRAEQALKEDPKSEAARSLVEQAQTAERERDAAAQDAQAALDRKDMAAASQALSRLLDRDPRHPAVPRLSAALNATFQQRAEEAQRAAAAARSEANAQAPNAPGFAEGDALLKEAQTLLEKGEYAAATGRFAEARDMFGRAQRLAQQQAAERQRKEEAQRAAQQRAAQEAAAAAAAARAAAVPTAAPPISTATASAPVSAPVAAGNPQEAAVRQLMAQYESAMESRDIAQLRIVWPTIPDPKRIEDAFKRNKTWDVGLRVETVEVSGSRAVVRAARQDTVNGTRTPAVSQTFRLAQAADGWKIESIGQ